jgi:hypothetical protein
VVPDDDDNSASSSSDESEARERAADAIETDVTDEAGADEQEAKAGEMHSRAADDYADNVGQSMGEQAVAAQTTDQAATHGVDGFAFNFSQSDGDPADDPSSPGHTVAQVPAGDAKRRAKKARQRARKQQQRQQRRQQEQQEQQEETEERVQRQQQAVSAEKPRDFPAGVLVAWGVRQLGAAAQRSGHAAPTAAQAAAIERELRWLRATDVAEEAKLAKLEVPPAAAACRQQQQHSHARARAHTQRKRERERRVRTHHSGRWVHCVLWPADDNACDAGGRACVCVCVWTTQEMFGLDAIRQGLVESDGAALDVLAQAHSSGSCGAVPG